MCQDPREVLWEETFAQAVSGGGKVSRGLSTGAGAYRGLSAGAGAYGELSQYRSWGLQNEVTFSGQTRGNSTPGHKEVEIKGLLESSGPCGGPTDGSVWPCGAWNLVCPQKNGHSGIPRTDQKAAGQKAGHQGGLWAS